MIKGALGPSIQILFRNAYSPVSIEKRDGLHVDAVLCASVNLKPVFAKESIKGVFSFSAP